MEKCVEIARCAKTLHQIGTKNYTNQVCEEITHNVLKKLHIKCITATYKMRTHTTTKTSTNS